MEIFIYNIKRMYKKKYSIIATMVLPIIIFLVSINISNFGILTAKIAIIDNDKTAVTDKMGKELKKSYGSEKVDKNDIFDALKTQKVKCVIVIDRGFTNEVIKGQHPKIKVYGDKDSNLQKSIEYYINSYLKNVKAIAIKAKGSNSEFKSEFEKFSVKTKYINAYETYKKGERNVKIAYSFLIMFLLFSSINFANIIFDNKERLKKSRIAFLPITIKSYMFQCTLNLFILEFIEAMVLFAVTIIVYNEIIIPYVWILFLIFSVFSITAISFGMFANSLTSKYGSSNVAIYMIVIPMCMLGGCFWDISSMPLSLRYIGYFIPTTWIVDSIYTVFQNEASVSSIAVDLVVMSLFSLVFFLMGMLTQNDIVD
ncbi:MAG: ABC transporter permease [Clostridium sp.]|nr:ABC transporter permease [Clostridium sp.]